jgi:biopolymer transport protein ExbD
VRIKPILVLVIIFLYGVPLSKEGMDVHLPDLRGAEGDPEIVLEYSADRQLSVNRRAVSAADLRTLLYEIYSRRRDKTIYLLADGSLRYGEVMDVINTAKGAGVGKVGVITPAMLGHP